MTCMPIARANRAVSCLLAATHQTECLARHLAPCDKAGQDRCPAATSLVALRQQRVVAMMLDALIRASRRNHRGPRASSAHRC
jgi:hypothetical protein